MSFILFVLMPKALKTVNGCDEIHIKDIVSGKEEIHLTGYMLILLYAISFYYSLGFKCVSYSF